MTNFASLFGRKPCEAFSGILLTSNMVDVAQLVRATDCGSVGRGFEPHLPPPLSRTLKFGFFVSKSNCNKPTGNQFQYQLPVYTLNYTIISHAFASESSITNLPFQRKTNI